MMTLSGATTAPASRSRRPSPHSTRVALGESWMPAPVSSSFPALSASATAKPLRASASAAVNPPIPAPATTMVRTVPTGSGRGRLEGAFGRPRRTRVERGIVAVERRAIGADDLGVAAHVEKHMRMVVRRTGADAHELARPDLDHRNAGIVVEMGNDGFRHGVDLDAAGCESARTIAGEGGDS